MLRAMGVPGKRQSMALQLSAGEGWKDVHRDPRWQHVQSAGVQAGPIAQQ
jgi:hypothetical protein